MMQDRLKQLLSYEPETGGFNWRVNREKCGSIDRQGYLCIQVDGKIYKSHRLAWLYMKGYFPENEIDHINRIKDDNAFSNLREVSRVCNRRNVYKYSNNKSGVTGVCWYNRRSQWSVKIGHRGKTVTIGYYPCFTEAVAHRLAAEQCLGWGKCNMASSASDYLKETSQQG